jgi:ElaB/YqjD/DUF883 family membrane-anchored ribosome-binding protein
MDNDRNKQTTPGLGTSGIGGAGDQGVGDRGLGTGGSTSGMGAAGLGAGDARTRAGSYDRKFAGEGTGDDIKDRVGDKIDEGRERVSEAVEEGRERAGEALESGKNRIAGQLETLGDRLEERARTMEDAGGVQRQAGRAAHRASEALDSSAEYLRTHDAHEMRDDLEQAIRERPLFSVGMAVGAGFLLARLLRD